jgi:hypothetical protein
MFVGWKQGIGMSSNNKGYILIGAYGYRQYVVSQLKHLEGRYTHRGFWSV